METINNTNSLVKRRRGVSLKKPAHVRKLLSKLINQAIHEEITLEMLRVVSYASSMLLKSMEISDLEERLASLEGRLSDEPKQ